MDAASYAAQKQQLQAEQFQRLMQMFMAARQNQQDQGWQREQFAYKQKQDEIDNARQGEQSKALQDYYRSMATSRETPSVPKEFQISEYIAAHPELTPAQLKVLGARIDPVQTIEEKGKEAEVTAAGRERGLRSVTPKEPAETPISQRPVSKYGKIIDRTASEYDKKIAEVEKAAAPLLKVGADKPIVHDIPDKDTLEQLGMSAEQFRAAQAKRMPDIQRYGVLMQRLEDLKNRKIKVGDIRAALSQSEDLTPEQLNELTVLLRTVERVASDAGKK